MNKNFSNLKKIHIAGIILTYLNPTDIVQILDHSAMEDNVRQSATKYTISIAQTLDLSAMRAAAASGNNVRQSATKYTISIAQTLDLSVMRAAAASGNNVRQVHQCTQSQLCKPWTTRPFALPQPVAIL